MTWVIGCSIAQYRFGYLEMIHEFQQRNPLIVKNGHPASPSQRCSVLKEGKGLPKLSAKILFILS